MSGCPLTGNVRHPNRAAAQQALRVLQTTAARRDTNPVRRAFRVYRCGLCLGFHLTHRSRKQYLMWPTGRGAAR